MLLIDGVKYELWTPPSEDEFERVVKEHVQDIFGENSIYFEKQKLKSVSGIGSIPDGHVIKVAIDCLRCKTRNSPIARFCVHCGSPLDLNWHIVEVELSSHPLDQHIVSQVSRFITGIRNPSTQREIAGTIYDDISKDGFLKLRVEQAIESTEIYKFLLDLVSKPPILTIVIEKDTPGLREATSTLKYPQEIKVVEFQTFTREGVGLAVHAHLFEPLFAPTIVIKPPPPPVPGGSVETGAKHRIGRPRYQAQGDMPLLAKAFVFKYGNDKEKSDKWPHRHAKAVARRIGANIIGLKGK